MDKSVPTIFVIRFVGTVLTVPAQKPLKQNENSYTIKLGLRRLCLRLHVGAKHLLILNLNAVLYSGQQMLRPYNNIEFPKHRVKEPIQNNLNILMV